MKKLVCFLTIMICIFYTACTPQIQSVAEIGGTNVIVKDDTSTKTEPEKSEASEISVVAVGDIMFHMPQVYEVRTNKGYNFTLPFQYIKPIISEADLSIGNFETTVSSDRKLSGYPRFNSPAQVLTAIKDTGFDALVTANNHCMDTNVEGAKNTINLIRKKGMVSIGTGYDDKSEIIDVKGVKLGLLAYTGSTNGLTAPKDFVNMIDFELIKKDIENIKKQCDFVIVYLHTGVEYERIVTDKSVKLFRAVADMGADCVLGSHPHVVRKSEVYHTGDRDVFITYSMGNFISNQEYKYTDIGTIIKLNIKKENQITALTDFDIIPVYRMIYKDTDGKYKRRLVLASEIEKYEQITEAQKKYIRTVNTEVTKLMEAEEVVKILKTKKAVQ